MPVRYVAMLRGIGPGDPRMRNAVLVEVLGRTGLGEVRSVISSGNYVFDSDERSRVALEDRIASAMHDHLGRRCVAIVRSRGQIDALCRLDPFAGHDDAPAGRCHVTFLSRRPSGREDLPSSGDGYRVLGVERSAVFFLVDTERPTTPSIMRVLEQAYGTQITTRSWRTVQRLRRTMTD